MPKNDKGRPRGLDNKMKTDDQQKEEILARTDMIELCAALGLDPKGKVARCPAHDDKGRPNLAIYPRNVHCFACGFNADAFDLVMKVKGLDFRGAFDFLAGRLGILRAGDTRAKGARGLGYGNGRKTGDPYPKPAQLPATPSPTLSAGDHGDPCFPGKTWSRDHDSPTQSAADHGDPAGEVLPDLPVELWRDFDDLASAIAYLDDDQVAGFRRSMQVDRASGRYIVRPPLDWRAADTTPLRARVFDALLSYATPASATPAGDWLHRAKGITPATQDRFGLRWLDWKAADQGLRSTFAGDILDGFGLLVRDKAGKPVTPAKLVFGRHRLLFPFLWKGRPVDVQGRDYTATDKGHRFENTRGKNPILYNADAILTARATGSPVFICEGATDTLTLAQAGRLAVGIVGTGGFKASWLPYFADLVVYLAFDGDDAGRNAAIKVTTVFVDGGLPAPKVVTLPDGVKDINQFFGKEPT